MHRFLILVLSIVLLSGVPIQAHAQSATRSTTQSISTPAAPITSYTLPPDKLSKSHALYRIRNWLVALSTIYSFLVLFLFICCRFVVKLRDWAGRVTSRRIVQALIIVPLFALSFSVLRLPFAIYGHHIGLTYGLSVQGWGSWLRDWLVELGLVVVVGAVVVWIFYVVVARSPRRWWLYFWLTMIPISAFLTFIAPVAIDPLFYQSEPLAAKHPELVIALQRVAQNGGLDIPSNRMFEMRASSKLTGPNAYVTGFGATKRVVVWDTAIKQFTTPELMLVFGHEMGHYMLGHVVRGFVVAMLFLLALLYVTFHLATWFQNRWGSRFDIHGLNDWAALPLLILIASVLSFVSEPALNAESRRIEHAADVYGMEVTHGLVANPGQIDAHAFQILGENWLEYPYPSRIAVLWDWDHPTISDRIRFAVSYDPWSAGESPRYVRIPANQ